MALFAEAGAASKEVGVCVMVVLDVRGAVFWQVLVRQGGVGCGKEDGEGTL